MTDPEPVPNPEAGSDSDAVSAGQPERRLGDDYLAPATSIESLVSDADLDELLGLVQATWSRLGDDEPYWSVISQPQFHGDALDDSSLAEFRALGRTTAHQLTATLARWGVEPAGATVLELGCGVGRVTEQLASQFERVVAVDVSPTHLDAARRMLGDAANVDFVQLVDPRTLAVDRRVERGVDVAYSVAVLQHNPPPLIRACIDAMLHTVRPGGLAVFQVPTALPGYEFAVDRYLAHIGMTAPEHRTIEMHALPQADVFQTIADRGFRVLEVFEDDWIGTEPGQRSNVFVARRTP